MNEPPLPPRPNDVTQPIPAVTYEPPAAVVSSPALAPVAQPVTINTTRYVHRFGSIPFYFFARFAAFLIDFFVVAFVIATFAFAAFDTGILTLANHDETGFDTLFGGALAGAVVLAFLCESVFGTTLGKLVFALHTRRVGGGHAGGLRVLVRYLLRPIDLLLIGPLLALVTPRRQRIGDVLSGTVVSRSRIGGFASLLGIALLVGIGYAQVVVGGGIGSAIGVAAEVANFGPAILARASNALGVYSHVTLPRPFVHPSEAPTTMPSTQPRPQGSSAPALQ